MSASLQTYLVVPHVAVQLAIRRFHNDAPVAVATGQGDRATITDVSTAATHQGVRPGMLVWAARRRCSYLNVVVRDPDALTQATQEVTAALLQHTDAVHEERAGCWAFALRALGAQYGNATAVASQLRADVLAATNLHACVGLAMQPEVATIAARVSAEQNRPCAIVLPGEEATFLAPLPVTSLPGVGAKTADALSRLGITTIGQLADVPPGMLTAACGARATTLVRLARGRPGGSSAAADTITAAWCSRDEPLLDHRLLQRECYALAEEAGRELRARGTATGSLAVEVRWIDGVQRCETARFPNRCNLDRDLVRASRNLLATLLRERRVAVAAIKVTAGNLGAIQRDLLQEEDPRRYQLQQALDGIKHRYGADAILPAAIVAVGSHRAQL